jgi:tight adherence protein C
VTIATVNMPILVSASAFLSVLLLFMGVFFYFRQRANKVRFVERIAQGGESWEIPDTGASSSKTAGRILNSLGSLGKRFTTEGSPEHSRMRAKLLKAGMRTQNVLYVYWGIRCFLGILLPGSFFLLRVAVFEVISYPMTITIAVLLASFGFYLPEVWLRVMMARRKGMLSRGFADVLDLMVVCVEAGMGLDAAISRVGQEMRWSNKGWSDELNFYNLELRAGKSRRDALKNLAFRTDIEDVNSFTTSLIQTDKFGTSLAQALRVYSDAFRTKRYQRAEEIAAKLPVRLVVTAMGSIFPALFVTILGPAAIRVYELFIRH